MEIRNETAVARRTAFSQLFAEYEEEHGFRFTLAWDGIVPDHHSHVDDFVEQLARRVEAISPPGAIAPTAAPEGWYWRERAVWIGLLGHVGFGPLHRRDRAVLIATAQALGVEVVLHENGVFW